MIVVHKCLAKIALEKTKKIKKKVFFKKSLGYGAAIRTGFRKSKYDCIYAVDGD